MRKVTTVGLIAFAVCAWFTHPANSDGNKSKGATAVEYDFGTKIVSVRTSLVKDGDQFGFKAGYLEKVQVRRLGDRSFLVGEAATLMGRENPYEGVRLWIPLSAVLELGEFENMEAVEKVKKNMSKLKAPESANRPRD